MDAELVSFINDQGKDPALVFPENINFTYSHKLHYPNLAEVSLDSIRARFAMLKYVRCSW